MTQSTPQKTRRRGRVFPKIQWSPEEKAKWQAENAALHQRCRAIFEQVCPHLIQKHYGWYLAIEPDSGEYFLDSDKEKASQKAQQKYPQAIHCMFCLTETGATGKI